MGYLAWKEYEAEKALKVSDISKSKIQRILGQVIALLMVVNGLEFLPDIQIVGQVLDLLGYVSDNLDTAWANVTQLFTLIIGLAKFFVKDTTDSVVASLIRVAHEKSIKTKSEDHDIVSFAKGIAK